MKKTTTELLKMMKTGSDYHSFLAENREDIKSGSMKIDRALSALLAEKKAVKADVIARSGIEVHYAYQIFSGAKTPTRDKVLMLCFGMGLDASETQRLLKVTAYAQLYARNERDNAILFGLMKGLTVIEMNELLYELGLELFT